MKKTLRQLYEEHDGKLSDKWSLYLTELDRWLEPHRNRPVRLLEIGVQNGGSLEIWRKYFPNARIIIGCDIDPKCAELRYRSSRIAVVTGNANSDETETEILQHSSTFDIIIDDGSHKSSDIVRSFARYFPHLSDTGIYVAEDLHCSYWDNFEGGLYYPLSAMAFFKRLTDTINHEHWRNNKSGGELVARFGKEFDADCEKLDFFTIHSVEFVNSLCAIRKSPPENNVLGKRVIVGRNEIVTSGTQKYNGTRIQDFPAGIKDDREFDVFELIARSDSLSQSVQDLMGQIAEDEKTMLALTTQAAQKEQAIHELTLQQEQALQELALQQEQAIQELTLQKEQAIQELTLQKEQTIQQLTAQLNGTRNELEQMKAEVLRYALSRSWRFTRPARKVLQWISRRNNV